MSNSNTTSTEPDLSAEDITDIAESAGGIAESTGDIAESAGDIAESAGDIAESAGDIAESGGDIAESAGDIAESVGADIGHEAEESFRFEDLKGEPPPFPEWMPSAIESLLLVTPEPVSTRRMLETFLAAEEKVLLEEVKAAMKILLECWSDERRAYGKGLRIVDVGGAYTFYSTPENARYIYQLRKERPTKLSKAALETLAIVAYRQPVTKPQMEEVRGVDCGGAVKSLVERNLVRVIGKADDVGRPLLYGTTKGFLAFFGIRSLHDLPTLRQLQELEGKDEPEGLKAGDQGPVVIRDLFAPVDGGELVSPDTKLESDRAMRALESALGEANHVDKKVTALTQEDGEVPDDWREQAAAAEEKRQLELALAKEVEKNEAAQVAVEEAAKKDAKEMADDALFEAKSILEAIADEGLDSDDEELDSDSNDADLDSGEADLDSGDEDSSFDSEDLDAGDEDSSFDDEELAISVEKEGSKKNVEIDLAKLAALLEEDGGEE